MAKPATVALVGGDSLMGRELRDVLATGSPDLSVRLIAADDQEAGKLTKLDDEPAFVASLDASNLEDTAAVFLAASTSSTKQALQVAPGAGLIDLSQGAEDYPTARVRAPMVEAQGYAPPSGTVHIVANAAAIGIALLLGRLHPRYTVRRSIMHVFEPASERGKAGLDELHEQTVNLLSFKGLPKKIFDAQLAFNLLARYGDEAPQTLEESELRLERHLATLLSNSSHAPMPSLRLVQAPVFHGYTISAWIEFEDNPGVAAIETALRGEPIDLRSGELEPPNIAGIAGQAGVAVGGISLDRNQTQACWLWVALDNLRLQAENAVAVARELA